MSTDPAERNATFLPSFFVLGAAKCGTTSLWAHLRSAPDVCMSSPKEPLFFAAEFDQGLEHYRRKYFRHWKQEQAIGDASHRNLYLPYVPERIYQTNPAAKLIVLVRNPIERAYSHWWHFFSRGREDRPFDEAIRQNHQRLQAGEQFQTESDYRTSRANDVSGGNKGTYLDSGYYVQQIDRYRELFPDRQIQIVRLDELNSKPYATIARIRDFLDCQPASPFAFRWRRSNSQQRCVPSWLAGIERRLPFGVLPEPARKLVQAGLQIQRRPAMQPAIRRWLSMHYRQHNQQLARLLAVDLAHWK